MKPLAGLFLALACLCGIAATGCVFELAYWHNRYRLNCCSDIPFF